jgi:hypothetical protein
MNAADLGVRAPLPGMHTNRSTDCCWREAVVEQFGGFRLSGTKKTNRGRSVDVRLLG